MAASFTPFLTNEANGLGLFMATQEYKASLVHNRSRYEVKVTVKGFIGKADDAPKSYHVTVTIGQVGRYRQIHTKKLRSADLVAGTDSLPPYLELPSWAIRLIKILQQNFDQVLTAPAGTSFPWHNTN